MKETNRLRYSLTKRRANGEILSVQISLDDDPRNGYEDFSMTGDLYERSPKTDRNLITAGCIHEEILKDYPELQIFADLHLSDSNGVPMHAITNGKYHVETGNYEAAKRHFRINDEELEELRKLRGLPGSYWYHVIYEMGLFDRWQAEANKAIAMLEEWTGKKFKSSGVRKALVSQEDIDELKKQIEKGYYTDEAIEQRKVEKAEAEHQARLKKIKKRRDKAYKKARHAFKLEMIFANAKLSDDNWIHYNHSKELVFNWHEGSRFHKQWTVKEVESFVADHRGALRNIEIDTVKIKGKTNVYYTG